jgi:hypothetical protein
MNHSHAIARDSGSDAKERSGSASGLPILVGLKLVDNNRCGVSPRFRVFSFLQVASSRPRHPWC